VGDGGCEFAQVFNSLCVALVLRFKQKRELCGS
jgi:hypothetical protein